MKTSRRPYLTQHRRRRLGLWALAMLAWIASLLAGHEPTWRQLRQRYRRMSIHGLAMMVKRLILLRAADIAGLKRKRRPLYFKHGRDMRRRHFMRSIFGSRLRRALDHRDPIARIAILIDALTHLDAWAARFASACAAASTASGPSRPRRCPPTPFLERCRPRRRASIVLKLAPLLF
jgi:hypothetical protein